MVDVKIKITGGITLFGALLIVAAILGDMAEGEGAYWKLFWAGVVFTVLGSFFTFLGLRAS